jgi:iron complex outermembrane receptor protein
VGQLASHNLIKVAFRCTLGAVVAICVVLEGATAFGQEVRATVRIEVRSETGAIPGAEVILNGLALRSDANGLVVQSMAPGEVKVAVRKDGFFPLTTTLRINEAREWVVSLELQPQETVEEEITVHATRSDVRIQDSPLRVEVIDQEEISEKSMMTPGDIVMMLNEMGGLRVQTTSPSLGAASVRIQGMLGRYTRFLSDGLPLFGQQGAGLGLLQIPPTDLGQVEVIKGTTSALYGSGAMGGVVNLISRRPARDPVHEILLNQTALGGTDATLFLASRLSRQWSGSVLAGGHRQSRNDRDDDGWADLAGYGRVVFRPRLYWDDGGGKTALFTGGFTYEDRKGGTLPGTVLAPTGAPYLEGLNTRRYDLGGHFQVPVRDRVFVNTRFAFSRQQHRHQFGEILERDRHDMLFGEFAVRGVAGRHTWVGGAAIEREAYRPADVPQFAYTFVTPGVFIQDELNIASWLAVSASARGDFHNRYGAFLSPRVSALLRWSGWTSRLSAGGGFYAPTPLTEETEAAGLTRLTIPSPLLAERGRSISFDISRAVGPTSYTATFFSSKVRHPVDVRSDNYTLVNLTEPTTNVGVELLGTLRKAPFAAIASYAYVRARETDLTGRVDVPLTPRHGVALDLMWENARYGRVGFECYYTGHQRLEDNPYRPTSEAYVIMGIMTEYKAAKHVRLFLNLENLTDARQTRWDPLLRPSRAADGRWTVDAWSPLDGRVINGGVRFIF